VRTNAEVREFLRKELVGAMREHQRRRTEVYAAVPRWPIVVLVILGVLGAIAMQHPALLGLPLFYAIPAFAHASQKLRWDRKQSLVGPALRFWNPTLQYDPTSFVPEEHFKRSGLFADARWNDYDGEDWIAGKAGDTEFILSELSVKRTRGQKKSDVIVFRGLFVVADFHKSFRGRTLCFPDVAERTLGVFGRALQKLDFVSGCQLIELEHPDFEQAFCTYASDPVEARYVLSTSLMQRLLAFRASTGRELRVAFADENLYLALPGSNLFESAHTTLDQAEQAMRAWIRDLEFATSVIEELGLNTRIWSKSSAA
jgi:hypothetical protein